MSDINLTRHMNHLIEAKDIREENEQLKQALAKCREEFDQLRNDYQELYAWASKQSWKELEEKYGPPWKTKAKGVLDEQ